MEPRCWPARRGAGLRAAAEGSASTQHCDCVELCSYSVLSFLPPVQLSQHTMSTTATQDENILNNKRQRTATEEEESDDEVQIVKVETGAAPKPIQRKKKSIEHVYIVFTCRIPLQNRKWEEHSGHERQDTNLVGVFADRKEANQAAMEEVWAVDDEADFDEACDDGQELFTWEDKEPYDWTALRVWVERDLFNIECNALLHPCVPSEMANVCDYCMSPALFCFHQTPFSFPVPSKGNQLVSSKS